MNFEKLQIEISSKSYMYIVIVMLLLQTATHGLFNNLENRKKFQEDVSFLDRKVSAIKWTVRTFQHIKTQWKSYAGTLVAYCLWRKLIITVWGSQPTMQKNVERRPWNYLLKMLLRYDLTALCEVMWVEHALGFSMRLLKTWCPSPFS